MYSWVWHHLVDVFLTLISFCKCILCSDIIRLLYSWLWHHSIDVFLTLTSFGRCSTEWCQSQEYIYRMMSESRMHLPNDVRVKNTSTEWCQSQEYIYRMMSEPIIHLPNDVRGKNTSTEWYQTSVDVLLALISFGRCILDSDIIL
jgi:predicted DNA-binding transcriptional regulator AlpA